MVGINSDGDTFPWKLRAKVTIRNRIEGGKDWALRYEDHSINCARCGWIFQVEVNFHPIVWFAG